jgi:hypothetical protein
MGFTTGFTDSKNAGNTKTKQSSNKTLQDKTLRCLMISRD